MIGGVTRHILPHLSGVPHLHVIRLLSQTLFHNARCKTTTSMFPKALKYNTIVLNYKPCSGVCIVIKLQFAIQNLVYVKSMF